MWKSIGLALTVGHLLVSVALLALSLYSFSRAAVNHCRMTYMYDWPEFIHLPLNAVVEAQFPNYRLFVYGEGDYAQKLADGKGLHGNPVLFIHGNAGSYKQVRSIGSVLLSKTGYGRLQQFNVFAVDLDEELCGVYGAYLEGQARFVKAAVDEIFRLYKSKTRPKIVLVGHSMGGSVALGAFLVDGFLANSVAAIVTLSTPHSSPALPFDRDMLAFSSRIHSSWFVTNQTYLPVVSVGGSLPDIMVLLQKIRSELTEWKISSGEGASDSRVLSVVSSSIPSVWTGADHLCIVWCNQLVRVTARALFDMLEEDGKAFSGNASFITSILQWHFRDNFGWKSYRQLLLEKGKEFIDETNTLEIKLSGGNTIRRLVKSELLRIKVGQHFLLLCVRLDSVHKNAVVHNCSNGESDNNINGDLTQRLLADETWVCHFNLDRFGLYRGSRLFLRLSWPTLVSEKIPGSLGVAEVEMRELHSVWRSYNVKVELGDCETQNMAKLPPIVWLESVESPSVDLSHSFRPAEEGDGSFSLSLNVVPRTESGVLTKSPVLHFYLNPKCTNLVTIQADYVSSIYQVFHHFGYCLPQMAAIHFLVLVSLYDGCAQQLLVGHLVLGFLHGIYYILLAGPRGVDWFSGLILVLSLLSAMELLATVCFVSSVFVSSLRDKMSGRLANFSLCSGRLDFRIVCGVVGLAVAILTCGFATNAALLLAHLQTKPSEGVLQHSLSLLRLLFLTLFSTPSAIVWIKAGLRHGQWNLTPDPSLTGAVVSLLIHTFPDFSVRLVTRSRRRALGLVLAATVPLGFAVTFADWALLIALVGPLTQVTGPPTIDKQKHL